MSPPGRPKGEYRSAAEQRADRAGRRLRGGAADDADERYLRWLITAIAVAMSLYHMYVAAFGPPEAIIFRGTHLLFALALVFLLYPTRPGREAWRVVDLALLALGAGFILHIFVDYDAFINRIIYIDDLTTADTFYAVTAIVIVIEGDAAGDRALAAADRDRVPGLRVRSSRG